MSTFSNQLQPLNYDETTQNSIDLFLSAMLHHQTDNYSSSKTISDIQTHLTLSLAELSIFKAHFS